jgi:hypothetical protein
MVSQYLAQLDTQQATINALTARIEKVIAPFEAARQALVTIPGRPGRRRQAQGKGPDRGTRREGHR